jgi:hypothetical protein
LLYLLAESVDDRGIGAVNGTKEKKDPEGFERKTFKK